MDTLFELNKLAPDEGMPWLAFMLILLKRALDSGFIEVHVSPSKIQMGSVRVTPDFLTITAKGRLFIADLGLRES